MKVYGFENGTWVDAWTADDEGVSVADATHVVEVQDHIVLYSNMVATECCEALRSVGWQG